MELNTTIMFPEHEHEHEHKDVLKSVLAVNTPKENGVRSDSETPILGKLHSKDTVVRDFTTEIMAHKKDIELNYTLTEEKRREFYHPDDIEDVKNALLRLMCERLAVIGVDFIQNQSVSRSVFASAQKSDDYLSVIYESVQAGSDEFPNFVIKQGVLYKKLQDKVLKQCKFVICIPSELMPSIIHTLHQTLDHPTVSTTLKTFSITIIITRPSF
jgi:hypothetical protein